MVIKRSEKDMSTIARTNVDKVFDTINVIILSLVLVIILYPLIFVASASISDPIRVLQGEVWLLPKGINLESYKLVFSHDKIMTGYRNTLFYTILGTLINLVMTTLGAYPLSRRDFRARSFFTLLFTFTMFFSGGMIPTYLVVKQLGLLDTIWALLLPGAVSVWNMTIMRNFFQTSIPFELQESAMIDGCGNLSLLLKIVLPLSVPIIAVMIIFYGVGHWNSYFSALIYLTNQNKYPLQLVLRSILMKEETSEIIAADDSVIRRQMMAEILKYAAIIVSSVPVLLLYPFLQKYFVHGIMVGALKG